MRFPVHMNLFVALLCSAPVAAQSWDQRVQVGAIDSAVAVALDAEVTSSGALRVAYGWRDVSGAEFVRVYEGAPGALVLAATLTTPAPNPYSSFGRAVALSGDLLAVGDPVTPAPNGEDFGAVHLYRAGPAGWSFEMTLLPPNAGTGPVAYFGQAIALEGDRLYVGAPFNQGPSNTCAGAVFVYERTGAQWTLRQALTEPTGALSGNFGAALALEGPTLAVGAWGHLGPSGTSGVGAVHIYERQPAGTFALSASLFPASVGAPSPARFLGASLALSGSLLVAGAHGNDVSQETGEAFLFQRGPQGWQEIARLLPDEFERRFGHDVALEGRDVLVTGRASGTVRRFVPVPGGWALERQYTTHAGLWADAPHRPRVRIAGDRLIVSDLTGFTVLPRTQAARAQLGCAPEFTPAWGHWLWGPGFSLDLAGELRLSSGALPLVVRLNAPGTYPVSSGVLLLAATPAYSPLGSAHLCLGGQILRGAVGVAVPGTSSTDLTLDLTAPTVAALLQAMAPVHAQYWFRTATGSHLTNSLVLTFAP